MFQTPKPVRLALAVAGLVLTTSAGAVAQPMISVVPDTLTFGDLIVGQSQTLPLTIQNTGTSTLNISSITENSLDFSIGAYPSSLSPGQLFLLDVTFAPQTVSSPSVLLTITSDASNGPNTFVFLEGTGLPPAPIIVASDDVIDFGDTIVGTVTQRVLTLSNTGTSSLLISDISSNVLVFTVGSWEPWIHPGESQDVLVFFSPLSPQSYSATLTIENSSINAPVLTVNLVAGAELYDVYLTPPSVEETLPAGGNRLTTLRATNAGSTPFPFTAHLYDLSPQAATQTTPSTPSTVPAFFDNFEDGNALGWEFVPGGSPARGVLAGPGANYSSFLYQEGLSVAGHHNGIYTILPAVRPDRMGFWVRPSQIDKYSSYVAVRDAALREVIFFFAQQNGTLYCNASTGGDASQPYVPFQWYHVEYRNIDWTTKTFDYYLDGQLVTAGVSMRNSSDVEDFSRIDLYNFSADATAQWDDIFVSWGEEPSWMTMSPDTGTVPAGIVDEITLRFDVAGLASGMYNAVVAFQTNAPNSPLMEVPVMMTVDSTATAVATPSAQSALYQNVPNPFERGTSIRYALRRTSRATLRVYDVRGVLVRTLVDRPHAAGVYESYWDGRDDRGRRVASGVYFYRLTGVDGSAHTRKLLMLR